MSSTGLSVMEPHPTVPTGSAYIGSARGGAGNFRRYNAEELTSGPAASGPPSRISLSRFSRRPGVTMTGRGGAGNVFKPVETEECVFQFDEEMVINRDLQAPVYHIGRGGAGNEVNERHDQIRSRERSPSSDSEKSNSSSTSSFRGAITRLARKFS